MISTLAKCLSLNFSRIQFTPDLMPSDITGTEVIEENRTTGQREFRFLQGPLFANIILADEINRTPPKTQAALLEAMQERQVTVGRVRHKLSDPFFVLATQNPIEQEGTYPLPEAQLDRFLLDIHGDYPSEEEEREIARRTTSGRAKKLEPVLVAAELRTFTELVPRIPVTDEAIELSVRLSRLSRPSSPEAPEEVRRYVRFGAGPRGSQALVLSAKARAAARGEAAADVEDIAAMALPALRHRLVLGYRAEADGVKDRDIVNAIRRKAGV